MVGIDPLIAAEYLKPLRGFFLRSAGPKQPAKLYHMLTKEGQRLIKAGRLSKKSDAWLPQEIPQNRVIETIIASYDYRPLQQFAYMSLSDIGEAVSLEKIGRSALANPDNPTPGPRTPRTPRTPKTSATPATGRGKRKAGEASSDNPTPAKKQRATSAKKAKK